MKKIKQVFDGFSTSQASSACSSVNRTDVDVPEVLGSADFQLKKTIRHGFPHLPSSLAFDPVQSLLAIGTRTGSIRLYGKPGVDYYVAHGSEISVTKLQFIVNQGGLISVLEDNSIHLWNLKLNTPAIIHSLKFNRERITCISLPLRSKYLYVGTERGNILVVNIDTFTISGYQIQWNRAMGTQRNSHPGPVIEISECPDDENKLLLGYENSLIALWDLKAREADQRFFSESIIKSVCWHPDGKNFTIASHDGSMATWNIKNSSKPTQVFSPHVLSTPQGAREPCLPICKVDCRNSKSSEPMFVFTGGLPFDASKHTPSLTVMRGKSVTVLEMDNYILDFITICDSPYLSEAQEPQAVICLLKNDLVILDLISEGYPPFENPYPMDVHESPVCCLKYMADCPSDLIPSLYQVSFKQKQRSANCSKLPWPISGGEWKPLNTAYPEVVLTGHIDGSVKFWDATSMTLQFLYKLKTSRVFDKSKDLTSEDEPFAIQMMDFDPKQKVLAFAGNFGQVLLYTFSREEVTREISTLEITISNESFIGVDNHTTSFNRGAPVGDESGGPAGARVASVPSSPQPNSAPVSHQNSVEASPTEKQMKSRPKMASFPRLNVRSGSVKMGCGFQAELCCQIVGSCLEDVTTPFTALAINTFMNLLCFANGFGFNLVDTQSKVLLMTCLTSDLYGTIPEVPTGGSSIYQGQYVGGGAAANQSAGAAMIRSGRKSPKSRSGPKAQDSFAESCPGSDDGNVTNPVESSCSASSGSSGHLHMTSSSISSHHHPKHHQHVTSPCSTPTIGSFGFGYPSYNHPSVSPQSSTSGAGQSGSTVGPSSQSQTSGSTLGFSHGGSLKITTSKTPMIKLKRSGSSASSNQGSGSKGSGSTSGASGAGSGCSGNLASPGSVPDKAGGDGGSSGGQSGFSRSRSSSMSSLERADCSDAIQYITFMYSYPTRNDSTLQPTVWFGTSMGSVACVLLRPSYSPSSGNMGTSPDGAAGASSSRGSSPRCFSVTANLGLMFSAKGALISMCFLDYNGNLVKPLDESNPICNETKKASQNAGGAKMNGGSSSSSSVGGVGVNSVAGAGLPLDDSSSSPDRQFLVLVSDKEVKVISLPSHNMVFRQRLTETSYVVRSDPINFSSSSGGSGSCLACYVANGHIMLWSLPSLRVLLDAEYYPLTDIRSLLLSANPMLHYPLGGAGGASGAAAGQTTLGGASTSAAGIGGGLGGATNLPNASSAAAAAVAAPDFEYHLCDMTPDSCSAKIARTFCFSNEGQAFYLCSPSELQRLTVSAALCRKLQDTMSTLHVQQEMPEQPSRGIFKSLFSSSANVDRSELFSPPPLQRMDGRINLRGKKDKKLGESSGKASKGLAKYQQGSAPTNLEGHRVASGTAAGEAAKARQALVERGEKLSQVEEATAQMMINAQQFSRNAEGLADKYKNKKWYQL